MKKTFKILITTLAFFFCSAFSIEREFDESYNKDADMMAMNNEVIAQAKQSRLFYLFCAQLWREIEFICQYGNDTISGKITEKDVIKKLQVTLAKLYSLKLLVSKLSLPEEMMEEQEAFIQTCKDAEQMIKDVLKKSPKYIKKL